jgi:hypothetical protein
MELKLHLNKLSFYAVFNVSLDSLWWRGINTGKQETNNIVVDYV